jgi:hypothetical protein
MEKSVVEVEAYGCDSLFDPTGLGRGAIGSHSCGTLYMGHAKIQGNTERVFCV